MKKIGVLGAGQLGRMLALAGYPLELDFAFFDTTGSPSVGIGEVTIDTEADLSNPELKNFLDNVDVVTYEFEHLPVALTDYIEQHKTLYPPSRSIRICQHRSEEKSLFKSLGIPTPEYRIIDTLDGLKQAVSELGTPVVSKTTTEGYDGKGQFVIRDPEQCEEAWSAIGNRELIVEAFVPFERELSIIAVRDAQDNMVVYPLAENRHHEGILRYSTAPAPRISEDLFHEAESYIRTLMHEMEHVGVLTLELFEVDGKLLANEMAPRVHNSGHWSMEGAYCSQFENHLRAIAGLPLGNTEAQGFTCMVNIIGEKGDTEQILALPYAHLHLYGKEERPGRKLGHVNVRADSLEELKWRVQNVASLLPGSPPFDGYEA
ncbi:MAG: 5-(carboxyamino)imidazole ribonucleotide synthase [Oleiphilaceae bacterium]|nr:5-(carboxyamino)imidazole ribonucleotide synthase [Oleiphilaceae bacterium]